MDPNNSEDAMCIYDDPPQYRVERPQHQDEPIDLTKTRMRKTVVDDLPGAKTYQEFSSELRQKCLLLNVSCSSPASSPTRDHYASASRPPSYHTDVDRYLNPAVLPTQPPGAPTYCILRSQGTNINQFGFQEKVLPRYCTPSQSSAVTPVVNPTAGLLRVYDNKVEKRVLIAGKDMEEVMITAKALFSKRTRTLFHWVYPNAPKIQIKNIVAGAWEVLGALEKHYYISLALGKYGCVQQSKVMVNPQLGTLIALTKIMSLSGYEPGINLSQLYAQHAAIQANAIETGDAVRNLLNIMPPSSSGAEQVTPHPGPKKRGRPKGATNAAVRLMQRFNAADFRGSDQQLQQFQQQLIRQEYHEHERLYLQRRVEKRMAPEPIEVENCKVAKTIKPSGCGETDSDVVVMEENSEDFNDDPELRKELEKFQWALKMAD